ncbi:hypothetical protein CCY99_01705 [Helicobacter sp. 16-1353]|nr:hypothetical protein CCY99_01705 [Helicobacter sp. 16-1353]
MPFFKAAPLPRLIALCNKIAFLFICEKIASKLFGEPSFTITTEIFESNSESTILRSSGVGLKLGIKATAPPQSMPNYHLCKYP